MGRKRKNEKRKGEQEKKKIKGKVEGKEEYGV